MIFSALMMALTAAQGVSCANRLAADAAPLRAIERHPGLPAFQTGRGLWIGGLAFAPGDVRSATLTTAAYDSSIWEIRVHLTASGHTRFREAQRCRLKRYLEISFDGVLLSRPMLQEYVPGDSFVINNGGRKTDAKVLAAKLDRFIRSR